MVAVVKTKNGDLHNELIRKNGDLKSVRETAKAFEMAKQGSEMMAGDNSTAQGGEQQRAKDSNEVNKITRPGRYSMRNNRPESSTGRPTTKLCCTGCGNEAHPKGVLCPPWVRTVSGAERAIILLAGVPVENRIVLVGK